MVSPYIAQAVERINKSQSAAPPLKEEEKKPCRHDWMPWKTTGYTGDWFHPRIVERTCRKCGAGETDEH